MAKSRAKPRLSKEQSAQLRKLSEKGLYKRKKKGAATPGQIKYQKSVIAKFFDVVKGNSKVVKTDRTTANKYKVDRHTVGQLRTKGTKVIVPVQPGERVSFSKKKHSVRAILKAGNDRYIREPFPLRTNSWSDIRKQLRPRDRVAVPFYRGRGKPLSWQEMSQDEFRLFWERYGTGGSNMVRGPDGREHPRLYEGLDDYIQIARFEGEHADVRDRELSDEELELLDELEMDDETRRVRSNLSDVERGLRYGPQRPKTKTKRRGKKRTKLL